MAEIILPPEENEETPQVPELNIDKPTENSKVITIEFEAKKTNKVSTKDTNQQLYTTDTDAWFEFKETSLEGANGTYSVVFRNRHDGSIFQRTGDVVNGVAYYKIPHQEIRHAGAWRGQIVYTLSNGDTTAREFDYDVKGHILDGKDVREIVVEDFETLMSQLRNMKNNAEQELAGLVNTANQNETNRQIFFDGLVEDIDDLQANYQELLDTGVLQTNINTKLEQLEEEYAPKLTEVTTQLAQKISKGNVSVSDINKNLGKFDQTYMSDEFISQFVENTQPVNAIPPDGGVTTKKIAPKAVTTDKTSFLKSNRLSVNQANPDNIIYGHTANSNTGELMVNDLYNIVWVDDVKPNTLYSVPYTTNFYEYDENGAFLKYIQAGSVTTSPQTKGMYVRIIASSSVSMYVNEGDNKVYEPYREEQSFVGLDSLNMTDHMINQVSAAYPEITDAKVINDELYSVRHPYRMNTENSTAGRYWSQTGGVATQVALANYYSLNTLIDVEPGQTLSLYHWGAINGDTQIAYSAYKSDSTPYNGSNSRINFNVGTYDEVTDSYTFTIPLNAYKIGLSMQVDADHDYKDGYAIIGSSIVSFTPAMQSLVNEEVDKKMGGIGTEVDITAEMFQKGHSPKELTKKIGIISAGQSNIDGRVPESELPSYLTLPMNNIHYASNYTTNGINGVFQDGLKRTDLSSIRWGFDLVTYYNLTQVANEEIYVMKWSQGGTSIDPTGATDNHWTPFYEQLESMDNSLLRSFESLIRACVSSQGENFDIKAMIWHQGEGDNAREYPIASANYYDNLRYLIAYCRGIVGNSRLPFITGTISHKSAQYDPVVEEAVKQIASEDPYVYLVDMKNADLRDAYHFNAVWNEYLGQKMYDCLIDAGVVVATKLNPVEPVSP